MLINFSVPGKPRPQGSAKWIKSKTTGKSFPVPNEELENWRARVTMFASKAMGEAPPFDRSVVLHAVCRFARPKSHYRTGKYSHILRNDAPAENEHFVKPDVDKLERAIMDSMTGVVYHDDCQVSDTRIKKIWGGVAEASICVNGTHVYVMEK